MLVFWKEKLVFLSVPKTGTTAIEASLASRASMVISDPPELKHAPVYRYNRFFRPMFEKACDEPSIETLAVMREPISWLGSWYRYRKRAFLDGTNRSTKDISFDSFVDAYTRGDKPAFANVGSQSKFLEPRPNGTKVNFLFRYENQPELVRFLEDRLQAPIQFERTNESPPMPLELSAKTEQKLRRKCSADFELYESLL